MRLLLLAFTLLPILHSAAAGEEKPLRILCTTFPIRQIAVNLTMGVDGVGVDLMIPAGDGCPHGYALTARDMAKLSAADALVVNGLGMEGFLEGPLSRGKPSRGIIDASADVPESFLIRHESGHGHDSGDEHDHEHGEEEYNPHLFVSPKGSALLASGIAKGLERLDPANAAAYRANLERYVKSMDALLADMARAASTLANRRIVEPHDVFDYLARDLGLEIIGMMQPEGIELSAAGVIALAARMQSTRPGAIFVDPQYPEKIGQTLSRETGVPLFTLDPAAAGPDNAPPDYFEKAMRGNIGVLEKALGSPGARGFRFP